jgi:tetratricopeptide (TPR) repeat protein
VLSLAQIYVDTDQVDKAVALLEDPKVGPLTLTRNEHAAAQNRLFVEETYKTALKAYIGSLASASDSAAVVEKAKNVMDALKAAVAVDADGQKRLVAIYIALARELEESLAIATPEAKKGLAQGFETFLRRVGEESTELNVLNWVAETFYSLGTGFDTGQGALSAEAKKHFQSAQAAYERILKHGKDDPEWLPDAMQLQVRMRLGMTLRRLGEYEKAIGQFEGILTDKRSTLNVQVEAARTYQEWGAASGDTKMFVQAMMGGNKDKEGKNIIWGWGRLSQLTARYPQGHPFRDTFHESRYNLAWARYQYASAQKSKEDREKYWTMAKNDIVVTKKLYSDMGGEKWIPQYDRLLKNIQRSLGEKQLGLAAIDAPASSGGG